MVVAAAAASAAAATIDHRKGAKKNTCRDHCFHQNMMIHLSCQHSSSLTKRKQRSRRSRSYSVEKNDDAVSALSSLSAWATNS